MSGGEQGAMLDAQARVPEQLVHEGFVAVPLTAATAALDYASYMASPAVIRVHSDGRWPLEGFTFEDDLALVARHEADHEQRRAFAFVLLTPSGEEALGCVYVNPLREYLHRAGADAQQVDSLPRSAAMVTFWLRQDQQDTGLAEAVVEAVDGWLRTEWDLGMHVFRVLPAERSSCAALERLHLPRTDVELPREPRPYLWYGQGVAR